MLVRTGVDMNSWLRILVLLSVCLNVAAGSGFVRAIYIRGGWQYLKNRLQGKMMVGLDDPTTFANRETLFQLLPVTTGRVVFVGDSHIQNCEWDEFFPGALNRGIGGDTSAGLLKRIQTITHLRPRAVFLMIGSNDGPGLRLDPGQTVANIAAVTREIQRESPDTLVYLQSLLPSRTPRENDYALAVNRQLPGFADGKRVFYIEMYNDFVKDSLLARNLTFDGEHLNGAGYLIWVHKIQPYVR
jgi:lysophospholipase L1-like esterase